MTTRITRWRWLIRPLIVCRTRANSTWLGGRIVELNSPNMLLRTEEEFSRYASLLPATKRSKYVKLNRGSNCEFINLEASAVQLREAATLPHIPLTVISSPPG